MYARGMTVREIQGHLDEFGIAVSPDLISRGTDAVIEEVREWQRRLGLRLPGGDLRCYASEDPRQRDYAQHGVTRRWHLNRR